MGCSADYPSEWVKRHAQVAEDASIDAICSLSQQEAAMNTTERMRLSPYAPVRCQDEFWWNYAVEAARAGLVLNDGRLAGRFSDKIDKDLIIPGMQFAAKHFDREISNPVERSSVLGATYSNLMGLHNWVPLIAQFVLCGRQIFDFTDEVIEMLEQTDFGDCTLEGWHPPYEAFYINFGKRNTIRLPWNDDYEYLDGAFVAVTPHDEQGLLRLKLGFSTCKKGGEGVMMPGFFMDFSPEEQVMPVVLAIEHSIERRAGYFIDQPDSTENIKALNAHMRADILDGGEMLKLASRLIVNILFYLESIGNKRRLVPGRDVPTDYTVRWEQSNPIQREKLKTRLMAEGYTPVYLLGSEFSSSKSGAHRGGRRTHWRRGHWRRQHHGQGNSLIKRKWIKPQLISAASADDLTGHIYVVGNTDTPDTHH